MITLEGVARQPGIAIAVAAVVDAKNGINGISPTLLMSGISALRQGLRCEDYPDVIIACDSLAIGTVMRIPGINTIAIAAEALSDVPELATDMPCVIGLPGLLESIKEGDILIVDGYKGLVHIDPEPQILTHYQQVDEQRHTREKVFITSEHIPAQTPTGETVYVYARMTDDRQLGSALDNGADGLLVDLRGNEANLEALCSRVLREVGGKPVTFTVDLHFEEILRAAMLYCTPGQVTLISENPELLSAQVDSVMDKITLEALQRDLEPPRVNIGPDEPLLEVDALTAIEDLIRSGAKAIAVDPGLVADAKFAIRSVSLEDAE